MGKFKKIVIVLIVIALIAGIVLVTANIVLSKVDNKANPVVTMDIEGYGKIKIELYPDMAPNTVKNFIRLAERGFYKGKKFSEIGEGLVSGGADSVAEDSEETAGPKLSNIKDLAEGETDKAYSIEGEFIENGYNDNTLSHQRGVISMSRKSYNDYQQEIAMVQMMGYKDYINTLLEEMYDSQSSGFFILTEDNTSYDGTYAAFGKVKEGMDIIDNISKLEVKTGEDGNKTTEIVNAPVISDVSVETNGVNYGEPEVKDVFDFDSIFNFFMQQYMQSQSSTTTTE
ncbi:MAG: peptidylprolyl isomerase [Clostridia bacterium]|jgi:peptidyl-prolyl cis-trans isomerase B (cyclophilin B)|nr:peptidylprolyl isomerase [Clostridia bacterium]